MCNYSFTVSRDSTFPEGRARILRRIGAIIAKFPNGITDRANCYLHGLTLGWVLSHVIGHADADEVDQLLPPRPAGGVIEAVPYGPEDASNAEFESLTEDEIPEGVWFDFWMGIRKSLYAFRLAGSEMPERSIFAWLGFLRGEVEGGGISTTEYDRLRALLPPVNDDLTPLVVAAR